MNYGVLGLTFLSVNLDFFVMLLFLLNRYRLRQVLLGYVLGTSLLLILSYLIGQTLALWLPEWALGVLGVLPIWLALRSDDDDQAKQSQRAPVLAVLLTYLSVCTGCNLAIFLPVLVGATLPAFLTALALIVVLSGVSVLVINWVAQLPRVTSLLATYGERLMRFCYVLIGLYVFWDSGLVAHVWQFLN
ncbi:cadmium resistance transporter [Lactiplantibacillus modestisalitolerans]|uniref:Cadmium resistance transporter n=1 Tax=Lactiplantibacillus modestisalitolerans TaxID=1457219 RepID=A0ABV5WRA4_9LACO|nr:cadmium resistance transporter [Lactiplantibacillus modestisalitolerans]